VQAIYYRQFHTDKEMAEKSPAGEMVELAGCAQLGRVNLSGVHADPGSCAQLGRVNLSGVHADPGSCAQLGRVNQSGGQADPVELAGSWAQLGRVNLAGGHADLVETVITLEEQLQTFFASMDVLTADVTSLSEKSLPAIVSQYEGLRPCFEKISRLEALIERVEADLERLERQVSEAEGTVERGGGGGGLQQVLSSHPLARIFGRESGAAPLNGASGFRPADIFRSRDFFI
jgi:hypothetical protein